MHTFDRWRTAIHGAQDAQSVYTVLTDYLRCLPADEIRELPVTFCRALVEAQRDVHAASLALLQTELQQDADTRTGALMHEISLTFTAASVRLAQFEGRRRYTHDELAPGIHAPHRRRDDESAVS